MATMTVEVVSAERRLWSGEASEVYARSLDGEIGILPGHQPCLLALDIAPVKMRTVEGEDQRVAVHNGFLYFRDNHLVILADVAEVATEIDIRRAERQKLDAERRLGDAEDAEVRAKLRRATVRLDVAR